ncbi:13412_t:CDS:2, partial [Gigaspora margarita]
SPRNIVFITSKYIIDNSEECIAIAYASIIDTGKPEHEFDISSIPICISYCMITVCINRTPKKTEEFIHFGADCVKYNSVTRSSNIKIEITILYDSQSTCSIIDIIAEDIDSVTTQISNQSSSKMMPAFTIPDIKINSTNEKKNQSKSKVRNNNKEQQSNHEEENETFSDDQQKIVNENEEQEDEEQPMKRKQSTRISKKEKEKNV